MFRTCASDSAYIQIVSSLCSNHVTATRFETKRFSLKWNISALKRFIAKMTKCFKAISWWREILVDCFFAMTWSCKRSPGPKKSWSQMQFLALRSTSEIVFQSISSILKCLFHHWSLDDFSLVRWQNMSSCSAQCTLCWVLFSTPSMVVLIEIDIMEKANFNGGTMLKQKHSKCFKA